MRILKVLIALALVAVIASALDGRDTVPWWDSPLPPTDEILERVGL